MAQLPSRCTERGTCRGTAHGADRRRCVPVCARPVPLILRSLPRARCDSSGRQRADAQALLPGATRGRHGPRGDRARREWRTSWPCALGTETVRWRRRQTLRPIRAVGCAISSSELRTTASPMAGSRTATRCGLALKVLESPASRVGLSASRARPHDRRIRRAVTRTFRRPGMMRADADARFAAIQLLSPLDTIARLHQDRFGTD